jgi:peptide/nickel transport system substrate-binding protein
MGKHGQVRSRAARGRAISLAAALFAAHLAQVGVASTASASHLGNCLGRTPTPTSMASGTIFGTAGDDVIVGTAGDDVINAGSGNDAVCGGGGQDKIVGGDGDDVIDGGVGRDVLKGGEGRDLLAGGPGNDNLGGAEGDDLLNGGDGTDTADGGPGVDSCGAESTLNCEKDRRGVIVVGETFAVPPSNPAVNTNGSTHAYWEIMYNGLLALDEAGNPVPELATEVPTVANGGITDNGATYTFRLRDDVFFHDGVQLTGHDVKFTFEKALLRFHARTRNMALALASWDPTNFVASIDVGPCGPSTTPCPGGGTLPDAATVRFRFANPYAPLLKQLNVTEAPIIPRHLYTGNPLQTTFDSNTVGTGPMKFKSKSTTEARVVRNPAYFRTGLPFLDEIVMLPMPDDTSRHNALVNGTVDYVWDVPNDKVAGLQADGAFRTAATQSLGGGPNSIDQFIFNLWRSGDSAASIVADTATPHPILGGPVDSPGWKVRKAVAHAIDRDDYLATGRSGIGTVAKAPLSSELPQHATDIDLPAFDLDVANDLLDSAGWTWVPEAPFRTWNGPQTPSGCGTSVQGKCLNPGDQLKLRFLTASPIFTPRATLLDGDLAAVGINLDMTLNVGTANTQVFVNRDFDTYVLNYAQGYDPHIGVRRQYHSDQISTTGTPNNAPGYKNAVVDRAFDQAVQTIDPVARNQRYHDFQAQAAQDLPYVWLIETPNVRGFTATCTGFQVYTGLFAESAYCTG